MNKENEFKAANVETAIEEGLKEMKLDKEQADIEIISKGGLFKKAVVKIDKKQTEEKEETKEKIAEKKDEIAEKKEEQAEQKSKGKIFIEETIKLMNLSCKVEEKVRNNELCFYIKGQDVNKLIGYRGETLDALQHLVANKINKEEKIYDRVVVDADFYRQKREQTLTNLARRLAKKAMNNGVDIELEPMTAFERRIIHTALQESNSATTKSEGEGRDRHIVIMPLEYNNEKVIEYGTTDFKKKGPQKTKKFGYKKKRF